jgi:hypothetical protein
MHWHPELELTALPPFMHTLEQLPAAAAEPFRKPNASPRTIARIRTARAIPTNSLNRRDDIKGFREDRPGSAGKGRWLNPPAFSRVPSSCPSHHTSFAFPRLFRARTLEPIICRSVEVAWTGIGCSSNFDQRAFDGPGPGPTRSLDREGRIAADHLEKMLSPVPVLLLLVRIVPLLIAAGLLGANEWLLISAPGGWRVWPIELRACLPESSIAETKAALWIRSVNGSSLRRDDDGQINIQSVQRASVAR